MAEISDGDKATLHNASGDAKDRENLAHNSHGNDPLKLRHDFRGMRCSDSQLAVHDAACYRLVESSLTWDRGI